MLLKVASSLDEVVEGWRLVYHQYVASALIEMNPFSVFTFPEYVSRNAAIILGKEENCNVCSVSGVLDSDTGLPLDSYFANEIGDLRKDNKKLIEIGLLASVKKYTHFNYMVSLLSAIAKFGIFSGYHDYVIGVHPRRKDFFKEVFGFTQIGETKVYHRLRKAEVALLYADAGHFETRAKKAWKDIYASTKGLDFAHRYIIEKPGDIHGHETSDYFMSFFKKMKQKLLPPYSIQGKWCMLRPGLY
jgi:hypothetical protein